MSEINSSTMKVSGGHLPKPANLSSQPGKEPIYRVRSGTGPLAIEYKVSFQIGEKEDPNVSRALEAIGAEYWQLEQGFAQDDLNFLLSYSRLSDVQRRNVNYLKVNFSKFASDARRCLTFSDRKLKSVIGPEGLANALSSLEKPRKGQFTPVKFAAKREQQKSAGEAKYPAEKSTKTSGGLKTHGYQGVRKEAELTGGDYASVGENLPQHTGRNKAVDTGDIEEDLYNFDEKQPGK